MRVIVRPSWRLETVLDDDDRRVQLPAVGVVIHVGWDTYVTVRLDGFNATRTFNAHHITIHDIVSEIASLDGRSKPAIDVSPPKRLP